MNPYLAFGIAMCAITALALFGTSYLAVYFNRKAKQDMEAALQPLADIIDGTLDLDEAKVTGRHQGHLVEGKVVSLPGGMGRVFNASLIDGAGGEPWQWTLSRSKEPGGPDAPVWNTHVDEVSETLEPALSKIAEDTAFYPGWFRVSYDPEAGEVLIDRPMKSRRDIPDAESFGEMLDRLYDLAVANRGVQGPEARALRNPTMRETDQVV